MIPIRDENPTRLIPVVNYLLIAANVVVFVWMFFLPESALEAVFAKYSMTPVNFTDGVTLADIMTIFTSMFMHAGFLHVGGNMLYLWIFGDNVEDRLGHIPYLIFYLIGGVIASLTHMLTNWGSTMPTVGASGAIAAVLGAYLVFFPGKKIATFVPLGFFYKLTLLPAAVVLGFWFILQFFDGVLALSGADVGGVAVWAHIGGFVTGVLIARPLASRYRQQRALTW